MEKQICQHYLKGKCRFGDKCKNIHDTEGKQPKSAKPSNICTYFQQGKCSKDNCSFLHGYHDSLQHLSTEQIHDKPIVSVAQISEQKFITADDNTVKIWLVDENGISAKGEQQMENEKITKVFSSKDKVVIATVMEQMISSSSRIYVLTDMGMFSQNSTLKRINDIFEVDNIIIAVGNESGKFRVIPGYFESFTYAQNQITAPKPIQSTKEIDSNFVCISLINNIFFCGHENGMMSAWSPSPESILQLVGATKIHDRAINKIMGKTFLINNVPVNYIITCSSDTYIKVFNQDDNFSNVYSGSLQESVDNITLTQDAQGNERFVITVRGDKVLITDNAMNVIGTIPSYLGSVKRFHINIANPFRNETEGNFLIVTDGNSINTNIWIKPGSTSQPNSSYPRQDIGRGGRGRGRGFDRGGYRGDDNRRGGRGRGIYY